MHAELTVSRDGRNWRRTDFAPGTGRPPLIELGSKERNEWDWGQIYTANSPPVVPTPLNHSLEHQILSYRSPVWY